MEKFTKTELRQITANTGRNTENMTDDEKRDALASITGQQFAPTEPVDVLSPLEVPDEPAPTITGGTDFAGIFMKQGIDAFKRAIDAEIDDLKAQRDALKFAADHAGTRMQVAQDERAAAEAALIAEQAKPHGDRVIIRSESSPDITATDLTEKSACDLIDGLPASADYKLAASAQADSASEYDFTHAHESGVLRLISIAMASMQNVWLYGERSVGKTALVQSLAKVLGRPFIRISHFKGMEVQALLGGQVIDEDGRFVWQDGVLTQAVRTSGAIVLIDEPTRAAGACELYQTLLDERVLTLDNGEVIPVAPDVFFACCDNTTGHGDPTGRFIGTQPVNTAFLDRFGYMPELTFMPIETEARLLEKYIDATTARNLAEFAARIRGAVESGEVEEPASHRRLVSLAIALAGGVPVDYALETAVYQHVMHDQDREFYRTMAAAHLSL